MEENPFVQMALGDITAIVEALEAAQATIESGDITNDSILNNMATAKTTLDKLNPIMTAGITWIREHQPQGE